MNRRLLTLLAFAGLVLMGFMLADEIGARTLPGDILEKQIDANHLRVRVNGSWQEVPLMPLAESACKSDDDHFKRYCE